MTVNFEKKLFFLSFDLLTFCACLPWENGRERERGEREREEREEKREGEGERETE